MGEVYHARDSRLDRTLGLEVLPSELAADAAARRADIDYSLGEIGAGFHS